MMLLIAWIIVLAVLLLILAFPVGIDAAYTANARFLKLKLGPFRKTLLPRKEKKKKKKKKKKEESPEKPKDTEKKPKKRSISFDDILTLAEIAFDALRRFRAHLSVDQLMLHWTAAASDPYNAVLQFGRINALLGAALSNANHTLKIRDQDIRTELDFTISHPQVETHLICSIQVWEILLIAFTAGAAGLRWLLKKKRKERAAEAAANTERSTQDGEL